MAPALEKPDAGATILPPEVSIKMPTAPAVSGLEIAPLLVSELLELIVTAGPAFLIAMLPPVSMRILPASLVLSAVLVAVVTLVSARAEAQRIGPTSNAAVAAESIKRCFVKIQFSSILAAVRAGLPPRSSALPLRTRAGRSFSNFRGPVPFWGIGPGAPGRQHGPDRFPDRLCTHSGPAFNSKFSRFNQVLAAIPPEWEVKKH